MLYVLLILVAIGYFLNYLSKKYSHYNIYLRREFSKHYVEPEEEFEILDIVENQKLLPVTFLQLYEEIPKQLAYKTNTVGMDQLGKTFHETTMSILPNQRIKRTYRASFNARGRYPFNKTRMVVGDFLGTKTVTVDYDLMQEVVVYPRTMELSAGLKPYGSYYGDISVQRWIINDPILNIGIRDYTGSEPQKNIHWASSLRLGKLMVKNFDYTTDNTVMLVLNLESQKPFWSGFDAPSIESCISLTRAVMEQLEQAGIQYGFSTNAQSIEFRGDYRVLPSGYGSAHFYGILEMLGRTNYGICMAFEELLEQLVSSNEQSTTYVILTPCVMEEYIDNINLLSKLVQKTVLISINEKNLKGIDRRVEIYTGREAGADVEANTSKAGDL